MARGRRPVSTQEATRWPRRLPLAATGSQRRSASPAPAAVATAPVAVARLVPAPPPTAGAECPEAAAETTEGGGGLLHRPRQSVRRCGWHREATTQRTVPPATRSPWPAPPAGSDQLAHCRSKPRLRLSRRPAHRRGRGLRPQPSGHLRGTTAGAEEGRRGRGLRRAQHRWLLPARCAVSPLPPLSRRRQRERALPAPCRRA
mmetsp:Transcript_121905/g.341238  ORF Transcript_121905/g.341238 Transcript_121905/m.341238 type:complete len:202 (+) Transcript_121905:721-1326(+)